MKSVIEFLYNIKKSIVAFFKAYFTIEGVYTCILPDRIYLKKLYKARMGKELNLKNPKTYTEKLQWLKLYDRRPEYTMMVDKWAVREYVKEKIGEEYLVPLANAGGGYYLSPFDINFDELSDKFVLKCNHDNGVIICTDKSKLDKEDVIRQLEFHLGRDYYKKGREWPYKNVPRKIYAEKFMENEDGSELVDYKVFCMNGQPEFIMVNSNRMKEGGVKTDMYDLEWNHLEMQDGHYPMAGDSFEKPDCFEELIELSKKFCENMTNIRVDFNYWNGKLYFGELTFFHSGGFECFNPPEWDKTLGAWLTLPTEKYNR